MSTVRALPRAWPHYVFIVDQPSEMVLPSVVLSLLFACFVFLFFWLMLSTDFGDAGAKVRYELSSWCHLASTYKKIAAYLGARTATATTTAAATATAAIAAAAVANVLVAAKDSPPAKLMKPIN